MHTSELERLTREAERAERDGRTTDALTHWRAALELLPGGASPHEVIVRRVDSLSSSLDAKAPNDSKSRHQSALVRGGFLGTLALLLLKFKFVIPFLLTKGKLLIIGLTKTSTLFSMLLSFGVYWTAWGWRFAAGLVVSIYVHEMGHVAALHRYGIKASAPMFIPGIGAFVRLKQHPMSEREDARVGLAGPIWGLGAAFVAYAVHRATGWESWAAIARLGAWINLFNLLPVWQLDGGRGFRAFSRAHRLIGAAAIAVALLLSHESLLVLLLIAAVASLFAAPAKEPDPTSVAVYIALVLVLAMLTTIEVVPFAAG